MNHVCGCLHSLHQHIENSLRMLGIQRLYVNRAFDRAFLSSSSACPIVQLSMFLNSAKAKVSQQSVAGCEARLKSTLRLLSMCHGPGKRLGGERKTLAVRVCLRLWLLKMATESGSCRKNRAPARLLNHACPSGQVVCDSGKCWT